MVLPVLNFRPEQSSYEVESGESSISVALDGGLSRIRRDHVGAASLIKCQWILQPGEYQYWKAFYNTQLEFGSLPFLIDLLLDQPFLEQYVARFIPGTISTEWRGLTAIQQARIEAVPVISADFDFMTLLLHIEAPNGGYTEALEQLTNYDLEV